MTSGLVNASFSLPEWQAVKMIFFAPCKKARIDYEPSGTAELGEDTCTPNNFAFSQKNTALINCDSLPLVLGMLDSCPNASL